VEQAFLGFRKHWRFLNSTQKVGSFERSILLRVRVVSFQKIGKTGILKVWCICEKWALLLIAQFQAAYSKGKGKEKALG
jgi:hypothetical protein